MTTPSLWHILFIMKFFKKKKKPVYDMADQSFVASVLDALNLSHGDAVLEISKDSVLAESYFQTDTAHT